MAKRIIKKRQTMMENVTHKTDECPREEMLLFLNRKMQLVDGLIDMKSCCTFLYFVM
jgi:hypothetical protein